MYQLEPFQERGIKSCSEKLVNKKSVLLVSPGGSGKCLGIDTPILMYSGEIKKVQNIKAGELLMGWDSIPRNVISVCSGKETMYRITPTKGDSFVINESHILSFKIGKCRDRVYLNGFGFKQGDIANCTVLDYIKSSKHFKEYAKLWRTDAINFPEQKFDLEIDPYFIGLWLGDGTSRTSSITTSDEEVVIYLMNFCKSIGCNYRIERNSKNSIIFHMPEKVHSGVNGSKMYNFFKKYNLRLNKHVPEDYKYSSVENRLSLLAGLLDSDGHLSGNCYDFISKLEVLADDICFLARSLGLAAYKKECTKGCWYKGEYKSNTYYRVSISGDLDKIPCIVKRQKASRRLLNKSVLLTSIKNIENIGEGDYYGFEIDGDRLFVLGDFTVTHNTVILSSISERYIKNNTKDVIIFVHKEELLNQTREKLHSWYGIISQKIDANTNYIPSGVRVFVAMVETFDRRSKHPKFLEVFKNVGLVIIDEAHIGNFKKIFIHFLFSKFIGVTATPISAVKKDPLLNYYNDIVVVSKPSELLKLNESKPNRGIVPVKTYSLRNINRSELKVKGSEFDEEKMGEVFSKKKQVDNTVEAYIRYSYGLKTICFNANVEHSKIVNQAFLDAGLPSRHLDGKSDKKYREDCFLWLKKTPNAILNNVGVATTGFDEPSVETVILNSSMMSYSLYIQKSVRVSRPYIYPNGDIKKFGIIIDMGDNVVGGNHGLCNDDTNWEDIFWNPKKPIAGVGVVKSCPECGAINSASARVCQALNINWFTDEEEECGYIFPKKEESGEDVFKELVLIGTENIDVQKNIDYFADRTEYVAYFETISQTVSLFRRRIEKDDLNQEEIDGIVESVYQNASKWHKLKGKRRYPNFKEDIYEKTTKHLMAMGFILPKDENEKEHQF